MTSEQFFYYVELVLKAPIERIAFHHQVDIVGDEEPSGENMLIAILMNLQHRLEGEQYFIL